MINMLRAVMKMVDNILEQMGNVSRDLGTLIKNLQTSQNEIQREKGMKTNKKTPKYRTFKNHGRVSKCVTYVQFE